MNPQLSILRSILENKHTTIAGIIVVVCLVGEIWLPQFTDQFYGTRQAAIAYGLLLAGDSSRKLREDTEVLPKP